jgi:hypothetical protein
MQAIGESHKLRVGQESHTSNTHYKSMGLETINNRNFIISPAAIPGGRALGSKLDRRLIINEAN